LVYRHTIDATAYTFPDLRDLLAKATPRAPATGWPALPQAAPSR